MSSVFDACLRAVCSRRGVDFDKADGLTQLECIGEAMEETNDVYNQLERDHRYEFSH